VNKFCRGFLFSLILTSLSLTTAFSQQSNNLIIDSFGNHSLPGWVWGGNLNMKYSHETDNLENGYAEILITDSKVSPNSYIGLIRKEQRIAIVQDNILSVMLQGTQNDVYATIQVLFDRNEDGKYDEKTDTRLESKPISLNFSGWKEIHININESDLSVVSKLQGEDFSILEADAYGIQLSYTTGKQYQPGKLETGIALVAERPNKEVKQETAGNEDLSGESYFNAKNYPNPFNPETNIVYTLKNSTSVKITVYDRLGREVVVLVDENQSEGEHTIKFNASNLPSGIYFYRIKTADKVEVRKMVFAK
jgi:hypothetical protein